MTRDGLVLKTWQANNPDDVGTIHPDSIAAQRMSAALSVVVDEMLPDPTECDYEKELDAVEATWEWKKINYRLDKLIVRGMIRDAVCIFWSSRRARFTKPKSAEERVTIEKDFINNWRVQLDGKQKPNFAFSQRSDAEIYRLGLIQQLKERA